jgi:hypothetical protein
MDKRDVAKILLQGWLAAFIATSILSFMEVKEESNSAFWLANQCSENANMRANIQHECIRAMTKMKTGYYHYMAYEVVHRLKFCGIYSCSTLASMFFSDFWQALRLTLVIFVVTIIANPVFIKNKLPGDNIKQRLVSIKDKIRNKFRPQQVVIEDITDTD